MQARAVDDLHAAGAKDRARIAGAERRQRSVSSEATCALIDRNGSAPSIHSRGRRSSGCEAAVGVRR